MGNYALRKKLDLETGGYIPWATSLSLSLSKEREQLGFLGYKAIALLMSMSEVGGMASNYLTILFQAEQYKKQKFY